MGMGEVYWSCVSAAQAAAAGDGRSINKAATSRIN